MPFSSQISFDLNVYYYTTVCMYCFSAQVKVFVEGLFHLNNNIPAFKEHLRDFLVQIKVTVNTINQL